jgi:hypothetical protein
MSMKISKNNFEVKGMKFSRNSCTCIERFFFKGILVAIEFYKIKMLVSHREKILHLKLHLQKFLFSIFELFFYFFIV